MKCLLREVCTGFVLRLPGLPIVGAGRWRNWKRALNTPIPQCLGIVCCMLVIVYGSIGGADIERSVPSGAILAPNCEIVCDMARFRM